MVAIRKLPRPQYGIGWVQILMPARPLDMSQIPEEVFKLYNSTKPEKLTEEFWSRLSTEEKFYYERFVVRVHGDVLSPRNRELLRCPDCLMKKGELYEYSIEMEDLKVPPRKLTQDDMLIRLFDAYFHDKVNSVGGIEKYWALEEVTIKEYNAKVNADRGWLYLFGIENSTDNWVRKACAYYEIDSIDKKDLESYIWDRETKDQRSHREETARIKGKSSFRPGAAVVLDSQVHAVMKFCFAIYMLCYHPDIVMTILSMLATGYLVVAFKIFLRLRKAAQRPFVVDPRSRFSEEGQRERWENDRKWFGYDKKDKKNEDKKKQEEQKKKK